MRQDPLVSAVSGAQTGIRAAKRTPRGKQAQQQQPKPDDFTKRLQEAFGQKQQQQGPNLTPTESDVLSQQTKGAPVVEPTPVRAAIPPTVRLTLNKNLAQSSVPRYLQDPANWPEDYKRKLLDPSSEEAAMHSYDEEKYGMPTFGYVDDPERESFKTRRRLGSQPGTIYSEAKAMDKRLAEIGMKPTPEERHALIGYMWLKNGMKDEGDPVREGSGKEVADLYYHSDPQEIFDLVQQGQARRAARDMASGKMPVQRDTDALSQLTSGAQITPSEATRLMSGRQTDHVNLATGGEVGTDPEEDFRRWVEGEGPNTLSPDQALSNFKEKLGIGTYEEKMGLTHDPNDAKRLARAGAAIETPQAQNRDQMLALSGTKPRSVEAMALDLFPELAQSRDVDWGNALRIATMTGGDPKRFIEDFQGMAGDVGRFATSLMTPARTTRALVFRQKEKELSPIAQGGEAVTDFIAQMALMHSFGVKVPLGPVTNQVAQVLPQLAVAMDANNGDLNKSVDQVVGGLIGSFDPRVPFDQNAPIAQRVSTTLNLGMTALGITVPGLRRIAEARRKAPVDVSGNVVDTTWQNMPAFTRHEATRIESEIRDGLIASNGGNPAPELEQAIAKQARDMATLFARAAANIEGKGGASAEEILRGISYRHDEGLVGVGDDVVNEITGMEDEVVDPPTPTGPKPVGDGKIYTGDTFFWAPTLGKQKATMEVWPIEKLIASTDHNTFEPNPAYPADLQPRERDRAASKWQVEEIARQFDPDYATTDFRNMADGSPIVMPDGTVVSGNGRTMVFNMLKSGRGNIKGWGEYQRHVRAMAGIPETDLGDYVAVRVIDQLDPASARLLAEDANRNTAMAMSPTEAASADANRLPENFWQSFKQIGTSFDTSVNAATNRALVHRFVNQFPSSERAALITSDGRVSMEGMMRLKRAAVIDLLGPEGIDFAERLFESNEESARLADGLFRAMPELLKAKSPELATALNLIFKEYNTFRSFQDSGNLTKWSDYKTQGRLEEQDPLVLQAFHGVGDAIHEGRSAVKVADALKALVSSGMFRDIADSLAGQEKLFSSEKDRAVVARLLVPSWSSVIEANGGTSLGDGYYAFPSQKKAKWVIEQAGMMVDEVKTKDYNKRYANQTGLFGEEQAAPVMDEDPGQGKLFSKDQKSTPLAVIDFGEDGNAIVSLGPGATVAEVAHESVHYLRRKLPPEMQQHILDVFGEKGWTREADERFARAFELYLTDKASVPGLDDVLASMAQAVKRVYDGRGGVEYQAEGTIGDAPLTVPDSLASIFDDMVKSPESWPGMVVPQSGNGDASATTDERADHFTIVELPKTGKPFTVEAYRGTSPSRGAPGLSEGAFYSPDEGVAKSYAGSDGTVLKETLSMNNPLVVENWMQGKEELGLPASTTMGDLTRAANKAGYDGIVFNNHNGKPEYVKFNVSEMPQSGNGDDSPEPVRPDAEVAPATDGELDQSSNGDDQPVPDGAVDNVAANDSVTPAKEQSPPSPFDDIPEAVEKTPDAPKSVVDVASAKQKLEAEGLVVTDGDDGTRKLTIKLDTGDIVVILPDDAALVRYAQRVAGEYDAKFDSGVPKPKRKSRGKAQQPPDTDATRLESALRDVIEETKDKLRNFFVEDLSHLERLSPEAAVIARRMASSRARVQRLMLAAIPAMDKAAGQKGFADKVRLALTDSRLQGAAKRWTDFAEEVRNLSAPKFMAEWDSKWSAIAENIGVQKQLQALMAGGSTSVVQDALVTLLEDASARVNRVMEQADFDALVATPEFQKALEVYKREFEQTMNESHADNEGVFSDALGPLDTYYPLVPLDELGNPLRSARGQKGPVFFGRRPAMQAPKNARNRFTTGHAPAYGTEAKHMADTVARIFYNNDKAALLKRLEQDGIVRTVRVGGMKATMDNPTIEIDGKVYDAKVLDAGPNQKVIVPKWLADEIGHLIKAKDEFEAEAMSGVLHKINEIGMVGPLDAVFHATNMIGTMVANTPYLAGGLLSKTIGNTAVTKMLN